MRNGTKRGSHLGIVVLLLSMVMLACNLTGGGNNNLQPTAFATATSPFGAPTVTINSPANNSEAVRGQAVLVQSTARDNIGVTRVELRVDGFIVNTVSSQSAQGDREFAVIQTWTPAQAGSHTVQVVAYRGQIASSPAQIAVTVRESAAQVTATQSGGVTAPPDNICRIRVDVDGLNLRVGPGTTFDVITVLTLGNTAQIIGRLGDNTWWQVRIGVNVGWVNSGYTTETGDCSLIPIVAPPASPTPRPSTATPTTPPTSTPAPGTPTFTPTTTPSIPDLVVSNIVGPTALQLNASGTVGARYTITVRNQGTGNSGQFTTSFQQPDGTVVQLPIVVNLAPGQTVDLPIDSTFTASSVYRLQAFADSGAQVIETDEGNNVRTIDVVVAAAP